VSDDVHDAIARLWQRSRPVVLERIGSLERTAMALAAGSVEPGALEAARTEAHKLAGSLGTFGVAHGSELARGVEQELEAGGPDPPRLRNLVSQLRAVVEAA
jgi:HPt (histidine-containing phosphotransfer) domain-containing protein